MSRIPLESKIHGPGPGARKTVDLTAAQRRLVEIMSTCQFGRIENMPVQAGQPLFDQGVKVVRVARLGGEGGGARIPNCAAFELKKSVCDLFSELERVGNGLIVRLEFRNGLPCLIELSTMPSSENPLSESPTS